MQLCEDGTPSHMQLQLACGHHQAIRPENVRTRGGAIHPTSILVTCITTNSAVMLVMVAAASCHDTMISTENKRVLHCDCGDKHSNNIYRKHPAFQSRKGQIGQVGEAVAPVQPFLGEAFSSLPDR